MQCDCQLLNKKSATRNHEIQSWLLATLQFKLPQKTELSKRVDDKVNTREIIKTPYLWGRKSSILLDVSQTRPVRPTDITIEKFVFVIKCKILYKIDVTHI